ncbi:hypothetical protein ACFWD1_18790 [Micromonospora chalcea]
MHSDEGRKDFDNRGMVDGGVSHNALKRVDGPEAHIHLVPAGLTKLLDGLSEPVGDLSRRGEVLLPASGLLLMSVCRVRDEKANGKDDHREDAANGKESLPGVGLEIEGRYRSNLKACCPCRAGSQPPGDGMAYASVSEPGAVRRRGRGGGGSALSPACSGGGDAVKNARHPFIAPDRCHSTTEATDRSAAGLWADRGRSATLGLVDEKNPQLRLVVVPRSRAPCKSVAKASEVRILYPPPGADAAPDQQEC